MAINENTSKHFKFGITSKYDKYDPFLFLFYFIPKWRDLSVYAYDERIDRLFVDLRSKKSQTFRRPGFGARMKRLKGIIVIIHRWREDDVMTYTHVA